MRPYKDQTNYLPLDPADQPTASRVLILKSCGLLAMFQVDDLRVVDGVVNAIRTNGDEEDSVVVSFPVASEWTLVETSYLEAETKATAYERQLTAMEAYTAQQVRLSQAEQRGIQQARGAQDRPPTSFPASPHTPPREDGPDWDTDLRDLLGGADGEV